MESLFPSLAASIPYFLSLLALIILLEQISYLKKKRSIPGPTLVLPLIGNVIALIRNTTHFWEHQASLAKSSHHGMSVNYIFGYFILFIRSTDLQHKIFANVNSDAFRLAIYPFGKKLLNDLNIIYKTGDDHKDIRRRITANFNPRALSTYTPIQQGVMLKHIKHWIQESSTNPSKAISLRFLCREMNIETSLAVLVGPYMNKESRQRFSHDYKIFNVGLLTLPIDFPGFAFRTSRFAVERLVETLSHCVEASKEKLKKGHEPTCLIDFWNETQSGSKDPRPQEMTSKDLAVHLFDLQFAAQDAVTSSLLWAVTILDSQPEVLAKVREEVAMFWSLKSGELITMEQLRNMRYLEAVAKEIIRIRAPATMVPHVATKDFPLTDDYTIPKGTVVCPSIFESSFQGFPEPEKFDPDRFMEDRQEDRIYKKNLLVFGTGPHNCIGQRYAMNQLMLFIATFTSLVDFKRHRTHGCDEIVYHPTISPKDDCQLFLTPRTFDASTY